MRLCAALCVAVAAALVGAASAECGTCIDSRCYKKHLLPGISFRYGALYRKTNTLYHYYYNIDEEEYIVKCNLDLATCNDTAKISDVIDLTVDQRTGDVYGTYYEYNGIYKLDLINNKKALTVPVTTVWSLTFKDKLYYSLYEGGGIYAFENGTSILLAGTERYDNIKKLIVDKNDDIYFYDYKGRGRFIKKLSKGVIHDSGFWDNHEFEMTLDKDDNAIFIDEHSGAVYRVKDEELVEVGVAEWLSCPLFDRDNNLVYYKFNSNNYIEAWHFKQEKNRHCTISHLGNRRMITVTVVSDEEKEFDTEPAGGTSPGRSGNTRNTPVERKRNIILGTYPSK